MNLNMNELKPRSIIGFSISDVHCQNLLLGFGCFSHFNFDKKNYENFNVASSITMMSISGYHD